MTIKPHFSSITLHSHRDVTCIRGNPSLSFSIGIIRIGQEVSVSVQYRTLGLSLSLNIENMDFQVSVSVSISKIGPFKSQSQYRYRQTWARSLSLSIDPKILVSSISGLKPLSPPANALLASE